MGRKRWRPKARLGLRLEWIAESSGGGLCHEFCNPLVLNDSQWPQTAAGPRATDWPEANCGCHLATGRRAATRVRSLGPLSCDIALALRWQACGPRARGRKGPRTQETFQATRGARKQSFCKDEKNLKAERRAKQKAATRFQARQHFALKQFGARSCLRCDALIQDVEEEYSLDSQGRENRRGRKKKRPLSANERRRRSYCPCCSKLLL